MYPAFWQIYHHPYPSPLWEDIWFISHMNIPLCYVITLVARFMRLIWGPPRTDRPDVGPMWVPWKLLSGLMPTAKLRRCILSFLTLLWNINDPIPFLWKCVVLQDKRSHISLPGIRIPWLSPFLIILNAFYELKHNNPVLKRCSANWTLV